MFHPNDQPMERGWVGRIDGERVLHLAAQTLQSFFLGGGGAREHAEYQLDAVTLLVPVLYPPAVRVFDAQDLFAFANPAAVVGPGARVASPTGALTLKPRLAAVIGDGGAIGGFTIYADWSAPALPPPKSNDFAAVVGPVVVTPEEPVGADISVVVDREERLRMGLAAFDWEAARLLAAAGTVLRPGDIVAGPAAGEVIDIVGATSVTIAVDGIGALDVAVS
jgi:hypothetical protein